MEAVLKTVPKKYISKRISFEFSNTSNLKDDIQSRVSSNIESQFAAALNNIRGDSSDFAGISFSEITLLALAYFYSEIFNGDIKDKFYTVEMVKGFLDANNMSNYTAIHEIDVEYFELKDAKYFRHCWLIIQSAWFFNSEHFGHHQHIDYLNHYINTGQKLPIDDYNFDCSYLEKKYVDIDAAKSKRIPVNGYLLVSQWYYSILFLICNELGLPTKNFKVLVKDNREYNPLTKTSRQLRPITPFKLNECDIKSAFPTFIDEILGSNLKDYIYNNLMLQRQITRNEAKILFNKICNSGAFMSKAETITFFQSCGYLSRHCDHLTNFTHNKEKKFISFMTELESKAIESFITQNNLQGGTRLHDAILFIDNRIRPEILIVKPNCKFSFKELNRPVIKNTFSMSKKRLTYAYINSIPQGLDLIRKYDFSKPAINGEANGFRFYYSKYQYISAGFNLNDIEVDFNTFVTKCEVMISTLKYLNRKPIKDNHFYLILKHIRENSNFVFNIRAMYSILRKYQYDQSLISFKQRDYDLTKNLKFIKTIDFWNAMNKAKGQVNIKHNLYDLFCLLQERIQNNDFEYMDIPFFSGRKKNNLLAFAIVKKFNLLCTGRQRKERKTVKSNALYTTPIKSVTIKSMSLNVQQQNAFLKNSIANYEIELKNFNKLVNNRVIVNQLLLILRDLTGEILEVNISNDGLVKQQLKAELLGIIDRKTYSDFNTAEIDFDKRYMLAKIAEVPNNCDLGYVFDTDLSNSIFNHVTIQEAESRGEVFFKEYLKFHGYSNIVEKIIVVNRKKENYILPELYFE